MPWSQWTLTVRRYFGELKQTAIRLLQHVKTNAEDAIITDNTTMTGAETTFNTAVLCACTDLQEESTASRPTSSQRLRVRGMETAVQEIWTASSREIPWNAPSPLVFDEISRAKAVGPSVEKQKKGLRGSRATRCLTGSQQDRRRWIVLRKGRVSPSKTGVCGVWKRETHRPGAVGQQRR